MDAAVGRGAEDDRGVAQPALECVHDLEQRGIVHARHGSGEHRRARGLAGLRGQCVEVRTGAGRAGPRRLLQLLELALAALHRLEDLLG